MEKLFSEFPPVSNEEWMAVVNRDLKGADFDKKLVKKTLDNIALRPFYRKNDLPAELPTLDTPRTIRTREEIREPNVEEANAHILRSLERGADELSIAIYPMGPRINTLADLEQLLSGVDLTKVAAHWLCGPLAKPFLGLLLAYFEKHEINRAEVRGSIDFDPLMDSAAGWTTAPVNAWTENLRDVIGFLLNKLPKFGLIGIRGAFIEKAGASIAQELGISLAMFSEYLSVLQDGGVDLAEVIRRSEIRIGVGTNYFLEIAKLRAARVLFGSLAEAYGVQGTLPKFHAVTTSSNKTLYDPHNNLLRATIESMAATLGGADSLSVAAYDQGYHTPDEFSEHLSRNTGTLLQDEAHLVRVDDPLAGSYTVEHLTDAYAREAWNVFLEIEAKGGFMESLEWLGGELKRIQEQRSQQVNSRRRTIVGTTVYANTKETRLHDIQAAPIALRALHSPQTVTEMAASFAQGAPLVAFLTHERAPSTVFDPFRPSWPFEHLRLRVERHVQAGGHRPLIWLVLDGDLKMRNARAAFCQSFFAAGGYDVRQTVVGDLQEILREAAFENADFIVLCSADDAYGEFVERVQAHRPKARLVVAGYPESAIESLKAMGVSDFVHVRLNHLEALQELHEQLGIPELPVPPAREEASV